MKRAVLVALGAAVLLTGCVVPGRAAVIAAVPAPVVVRHVHGPHCGHLWGFYEGHPVYYHRGTYSYWDGHAWLELRRPPVVYHHRTWRPSRDHRYHHRHYTPEVSPRSRRYTPEGWPARRHRAPGKADQGKSPKHRAAPPYDA